MKFLRNLLIGLVLCWMLPIALQTGRVAIAETNPALTRQPLWSVEQQASRNLTVASGSVFVPTYNSIKPDGQFYALDAVSGTQQWVSAEPVQKILSIENNTIYATNATYHLMVLDAATGATKTTFQWADPEEMVLGSAIAAYQDAFIIGQSLNSDTNQDEIFALTPDNQRRWSFLTPPDSLVSANFYEPSDVITPKLQDGVLILPILVNPQKENRGYEITALDAATGTVLWTWSTLGNLKDVTVIGDAVYPAYVDRNLTDGLSWVKALDLKTGEERWTYSTVGVAKLESDREVFIQQRENNGTSLSFAVLDKLSGAESRHLTLAFDSNQAPGELAIADNTIYASDLQIENATWGFYASADNHTWINAYDANDGRVLWRTPTFLNSHLYTPTVEGSQLFVASRALESGDTGVIQAFERSPYQP